ncbi:MAG TPA: HD domain-containing protein [Firmicutes bacterium]|jgi:3'-5' exoribonuclease|nr:HD domain-containing protein [Bacillota bacterium]
MEVKEIVKEGSISGIYLILDSQWRVARNGNPFAALRVGDKSGEIPLKVWEITEEVFAKLQKGKVIQLKAMAKNFNGSLQLEANGGEEFFRVCQEGEYDPSAFLPGVYGPKLAALWEVVDQTRKGLKYKPYRLLLAYFFEDDQFRQSFGVAPGAMRIHHAYRGGLLEHTVGVVTICQTVAAYYPEVNRDLLLTGALLHDIGKPQSYTGETSIEGTDQGRLLGHLMLGAQMVTEAIKAIRTTKGEESFPSVLEMPLLHLLLSHHGELEWGSPVQPALLEACLLHHADHMDAEAAKFREALRNHPDKGGNWTAYNRALKRSVYSLDLEATSDEWRGTGTGEE